jgi:predicted dehydrogenase
VKYIETFHHLNASVNDPWKPEIPPQDRSVNPNVHHYANLEELVQWRLYKSGTGMLGELAAQQFDAVRLMLGDGDAKPLAVTGIGGKYLAKDDRQVEDHVYCTLELPKDVVVTWAGISSNGGEGYGEFMLGTRGTLWFLNEQDMQAVNPPAPPPPGGPKQVAAPKGVSVSVEPASKGQPTMYSAASVGFTAASATNKAKVSVGYTESLQKFAAAVRLNRQDLVGCTGEQGLQVAVMALAAQQALRNGRRIPFESDWFNPESEKTPDPKPADQSLAKQARLAV